MLAFIDNCILEALNAIDNIIFKEQKLFRPLAHDSLAFSIRSA